MASRIKTVYTDCLSAIKSLTKINDKSGLTENVFKYCNVWNNQPYIQEKEKNESYPFKTPAVFVGFELGNAMQLAYNMTSYPEAELSFYIVHEYLNDIGGDMDKNLKVFELRDYIKTKFSSVSISFCSSLVINQEIQDFNHDNVYVYKISFKTNFIDSKGSVLDTDSGAVWGFLENPTLNVNVFIAWSCGRKYTSNIDSSSIFYQSSSGLRYVSSNGAYYITSDSGSSEGIFASVVSLNGDVYVCLETNSDLVFDESKWFRIYGWTPKKYQVGDISAFYSRIYKCKTENEDDLFNESNWEIIIG